MKAESGRGGRARRQLAPAVAGPNPPVPAGYCRFTSLTWNDVAQND